MLSKFKISLILGFLGLIFSVSNLNGQVTLLRPDKKLVYRESFTFKDTANGNINLLDTSNRLRFYPTKIFLGVFVKRDSFLLLHDSSYLVKNASVDFYKKNLKPLTLNKKGNRFFYDKMNFKNAYAFRTALLLNDESLKKIKRKSHSIITLKTVCMVTMIPGFFGPLVVVMGAGFKSQDIVDVGTVLMGVTVASIGTIILLNKKQRKLNKKMVERYNSLLLQP